MTKKRKRPLQLEESPVEYPGGTGIGLDFDDYDDEEIIDLDDEIQLSDISYDEDDLGESNIEVLDIDSGGFLDLAAGSEPEKESDLFSEKPLQEVSSEAPVQVVHLDGLNAGSEPDVLEELSLLGGCRPAETEPAEKQSDAGTAPGPNAAVKPEVPEGKTEATTISEMRDSDVELKWEPAEADSPPPEFQASKAAESSVTSPEIEELVSRMEERIGELLRETIRSELPGLVRSVIRDEIERLKKGLQ